MILVTGASGYIGGRLVPELLARGYRVRVMVRAPSPEYQARWPSAEIAVADLLDPQSLEHALDGIHTAYYLVHSLLMGPQEFEAKEISAAINFREAAAKCNLKRIIYLGGLGEQATALSPHLKSRMRVAQELSAGLVPLTALRAAVIVGSGSASFEIMKNLIERFFILPMPRWAKTLCQPTAIHDVIKYLVGIMEVEEAGGRTFDIGGEEILSYEELFKLLANILNKNRFFVRVPFSNFRLFSYFTSLATPVPHRIVRCLIEGGANEVICLENDIRRLLPFPTLPLKTALSMAVSREEEDKVFTRWSDAYPPAHELATKLVEMDHRPRFFTSHSLITDRPAAELYQALCSVGGKEGWFHSNWLWRLRGWLDRLLMGVGTSRGRRSSSSLRINDVIDFWRVEDLRQNEMLLLRAEMKLPGKAWLEFLVNKTHGHNRLSISAYYEPRGFLGHAYWYACIPFHFLIFSHLIKQIANKKAGSC